MSRAMPDNGLVTEMLQEQRRFVITFFTFSEDQSGAVCPLGDVFEALRAVIQRKHSRHVGEQSLGGRGHARLVSLFVCLLLARRLKQSILLLSFLPALCKCCWSPCLCGCAALGSAEPVDTPPCRPHPCKMDVASLLLGSSSRASGEGCDTHLVTPTIRPGIMRTRLSRTAKKAA